MLELVKSFTYGENLSENTAVKFSEEGVVVKATSADDIVCGITLFAGNQGVKGDVLMLGLGKASVSGACSAGDFLTVDSTGKLKTVDLSEIESTTVVVGRSLETSSDDALLSVIVNPQIVFLPVQEEQTEENENS